MADLTGRSVIRFQHATKKQLVLADLTGLALDILCDLYDVVGI
jgi:hypothetical protein